MYEPDLNPVYRDLGEHYGEAIIPALTLSGQGQSQSGGRSCFGGLPGSHLRKSKRQKFGSVT